MNLLKSFINPASKSNVETLKDQCVKSIQRLDACIDYGCVFRNQLNNLAFDS